MTSHFVYKGRFAFGISPRGRFPVNCHRSPDCCVFRLNAKWFFVGMHRGTWLGDRYDVKRLLGRLREEAKPKP